MNLSSRKVGRFPTTLLVLSLFATLQAQPPQWWANRGVIVAGPANDYAAVTQGQLKQIAKLAMDEFNAHMPGGAGTAIQQMVSGWSTTSGQATDFAGATVGHVKRVAAPFYDRLGEPYPWTATTTDDADLAIATIGQVKHAFSFEINGSGLDQLVTTAEDVPRSLYLGQGALQGTISYQVTVAPTNGQLLGTPPNVTYQPYAHYSGSDAFTFQASNGTQTATGHVSITVTPFDDPPLVDAGDLAQATVGVPLSISGTVTDIDTPPSAITTLWTRLSGPGTAVFGDDEALSTTVVFNTPGDHYLELVANGGGAPRGDTLLVKVQSAGSPAGPGVSLSATPTVVNKPNSITLSASVTGTCTKVEFYEGSRLLATDLSPPYSYEWISSTTGKFRLKAVAYNGTAFTRSSSVIATVLAQGISAAEYVGPGNNGNAASGGNGGSNPGSNTPPSSHSAVNPETHDFDGDGLTDAEELRIGTRPDKKHSDGDGVPDNEDAWPNSTALVAPRVGEASYVVVNLSTAPFGLPATATIIGMDDSANILYSTPNENAPPNYFVFRLDTKQSVPVPFQALSISSNGVIAGYQGSIGYHWAFMQGGNPTPDTNSQTNWTQSTASNGTVTVCRGRGPATNGQSRGLAFRLPDAPYPSLDTFGGTSGKDLKTNASDLYGAVVNSGGVIGGYRSTDSEVAGGNDPDMILIESEKPPFRSEHYRFLDLSDDIYSETPTAMALGETVGTSQALFPQASGWSAVTIQAFDPTGGNYKAVLTAKKVNARAELLSNQGLVRNGIIRNFSELVEGWTIASVNDLNNNGTVLCEGISEDGGVSKLLLVPFDLKVHQGEEHRGPQGSRRVYKRSPKNDGIASNLFALWPTEKATIEIKGLESVIQALPTDFIDWDSEAGGASIDIANDKLKADVSWAYACGFGQAYVVTVKVGENEFEVLFNVPDVGDLDESDLPAHINPGLLATVFLAAEPFKHHQQAYGPSPRGDALKHAGYSAFTISIPAMTPEEAHMIQTAHEYFNYMNGAPAFETAMDLFNNAIGHAEYDPNKSVVAWYEYFSPRYAAGDLMIWHPATPDPENSDGLLRWSNGEKVY